MALFGSVVYRWTCRSLGSQCLSIKVNLVGLLQYMSGDCVPFNHHGEGDADNGVAKQDNPDMLKWFVVDVLGMLLGSLMKPYALYA